MKVSVNKDHNESSGEFFTLECVLSDTSQTKLKI